MFPIPLTLLSMRQGGGGGTTRFKCHVINSRIMRANKAIMEVGQVFAQLKLAILKVCYAAW